MHVNAGVAGNRTNKPSHFHRQTNWPVVSLCKHRPYFCKSHVTCTLLAAYVSTFNPVVFFYLRSIHIYSILLSSVKHFFVSAILRNR